MSTKELNTEVEIGDYRGNPVLTVWELEDDGTRKKFPLISVGTRKCKAIIKHIEDIEEFVGE